ANNCTATTAVVNITQPAIALSATTNNTDVTCFGAADGEITVTASGGTAAYEYSIDGGTTYQVSNVFGGLSPGAYTITVRDANNCTATTAVVNITQPTELVISETHTDAICDENGTVTISVTGGTAPYSGLGTFTGLSSGDHDFTVIDNNGCSKTITVELKDFCGPEIFLPNVFTPEGDKDNVFQVFGHHIAEYNLTIFNRWGEIIFHSNDINISWDGKYLNELMEQGVYPYTITYKGFGKFGKP